MNQVSADELFTPHILAVHVLKYGSDPLQTYLPDSDIDITVVPAGSRVAPLTQLKCILEQLENYK